MNQLWLLKGNFKNRYYYLKILNRNLIHVGILLLLMYFMKRYLTIQGKIKEKISSRCFFNKHVIIAITLPIHRYLMYIKPLNFQFPNQILSSVLNSIFMLEFLQSRFIFSFYFISFLFLLLMCFKIYFLQMNSSSIKALLQDHSKSLFVLLIDLDKIKSSHFYFLHFMRLNHCCFYFCLECFMGLLMCAFDTNNGEIS